MQKKLCNAQLFSVSKKSVTFLRAEKTPHFL